MKTVPAGDCVWVEFKREKNSGEDNLHMTHITTWSSCVVRFHSCSWSDVSQEEKIVTVIKHANNNLLIFSAGYIEEALFVLFSHMCWPCRRQISRKQKSQQKNLTENTFLLIALIYNQLIRQQKIFERFFSFVCLGKAADTTTWTIAHHITCSTSQFSIYSVCLPLFRLILLLTKKKRETQKKKKLTSVAWENPV